MKRTFRRAVSGLGALVVFALLLGQSAFLSAHVQAAGPTALPQKTKTPAPYVGDEVLVKFRPGAARYAIRQTVLAHDAQALAEPALASLGVTRLKVPPGMVLDVVADLRQSPLVEYAQPNYLVRVPRGEVEASAAVSSPFRFYFPHAAKAGSFVDLVPNDPFWSSQYGPVSIQAPQAWNATTGSSSVVIAVIDSGIDLSHPDLSPKIWTNPGEAGSDGNGQDKRSNGVDDDGDGYVDDWRGWNFVRASSDPQDDYGHGTHVAGIAAAATNNGIGIAGLSWGAPVMVLKVLDQTGTGAEGDVASAIIWATDHGARAINLSLGTPINDPVLEAAVNYAYAHAVTVVAAAGNDGDLGVIYPAAYPNVIAVASVGRSNLHSSFSSFGPEVAVAAPGEAIYSTYWNSTSGSSYASLSGTSMAAPHVAGVAALLASLPPFDTPDKIRAALQATALDMGDPGWDELYGYGLIQAYRALLADPAQITPTPTSPPPLNYAVATSLTCPPGVAFNWLSAAGGTNTNLHEDDNSLTVSLPFNFVFNDQTETWARISTNGYLTFESNGTAYENFSLPNSRTPNDFIAPFWDDLNPKTGGNIYYATLGSAPNRQFVVEWNNIPRYASNPPYGEGTLTFQIVLTEARPDILLQYQTLVGPNASGDSATVGIEFAKGVGGVQYSYNTPGALQGGVAIRFSPTSGPTPVPAPTCTPASTATP